MVAGGLQQRRVLGELPLGPVAPQVRPGPEPDPCGADLDGNLVINGSDLGLLLAAWTGNNDCASESCLAADFNGDGRVDGFDMGLFLSAWGNDCTGN